MSVKNQVKLPCHTCEGEKYVWEDAIGDDGELYKEKILCYECRGAGFVFAERYEEI